MPKMSAGHLVREIAHKTADALDALGDRVQDLKDSFVEFRREQREATQAQGRNIDEILRMCRETREDLKKIVEQMPDDARPTLRIAAAPPPRNGRSQ